MATFQASTTSGATSRGQRSPSQAHPSSSSSTKSATKPGSPPSSSQTQPQALANSDVHVLFTEPSAHHERDASALARPTNQHQDQINSQERPASTSSRGSPGTSRAPSPYPRAAAANSTTSEPRVWFSESPVHHHQHDASQPTNQHQDRHVTRERPQSKSPSGSSKGSAGTSRAPSPYPRRPEGSSIQRMPTSCPRRGRHGRRAQPQPQRESQEDGYKSDSSSDDVAARDYSRYVSPGVPELDEKKEEAGPVRPNLQNPAPRQYRYIEDTALSRPSSFDDSDDDFVAEQHRGLTSKSSAEVDVLLETLMSGIRLRQEPRVFPGHIALAPGGPVVACNYVSVRRLSQFSISSWNGHRSNLMGTDSEEEEGDEEKEEGRRPKKGFKGIWARLVGFYEDFYRTKANMV